jgi:hypothetical protein
VESVDICVVPPGPVETVHLPDSGQRFAGCPQPQSPRSLYQFASIEGSEVVGS